MRNTTVTACTHAFPLAVCMQATGGRPRPGSTQTVAQQLPGEQLEQLLGSQGFAGFLESVVPRWEGRSGTRVGQPQSLLHQQLVRADVYTAAGLGSAVA